jgi:hypothetical protein
VLKNRGMPAKFGVALATTYTVFFVFNKWAFANYYFTLMALSALAAAAALDRLDEKPPESATPTP